MPWARPRSGFTLLMESLMVLPEMVKAGRMVRRHWGGIVAYLGTGVAPQEITAIVAAWQAGAISLDTMTDLFRRGEVLPEGRSTEEEMKLIATAGKPTAATAASP